MKLTDWINLALTIVSFLLAAISVVSVILTLRQNNRMIENSTRPYISLYGNTTHYSVFNFYLVLRNFGNSGALITNFFCDIDLSKCIAINDTILEIMNNRPIPFEHIIGYTLNPGQALQFPVDFYKMLQLNKTPTFVVEYSSSEKKYTEKFQLNLLAHFDYLNCYASSDIKPEQVISRVLQDMIIRKL